MQSRRPPREPGGRFYWVWVAAGLGGIGWIWWQTCQLVEPGPEPAYPAIRPDPVQLKPAPTPIAARTGQVHQPQSEWPDRPPPVLTNSSIGSMASGHSPRPVENVLEAQVALVRQGISSGSLDGVLGSQTRAALRTFQEKEHLSPSGALDEATRARLLLTEPALSHYRITAADVARPRPLARTWLGKSQQYRLEYETLLELVAERGHGHPELIRRLNPSVNWSQAAPGTVVKIPAAEYPVPLARAACVRIHLAWKRLQVFDAQNRLLAHFPCSIGRRVEKRPVGELHVISVVHNPNYVFNPEIFPESAEGRALGRRLVLPPGPNNPVGTAWIGLDRPGYGIHGTPRPEEVGRTESHGCFRLANWNAEFLAQLVTTGTPVRVEP